MPSTTERAHENTFDFSALASFLHASGAGGYLIDADGSSPDQLYLSGFDAPDPFLTLFVPDEGSTTSDDRAVAGGTVHLLVSGLEFGRARTESRAATVSRLADYDYREQRADHGRAEATARVYAAFLADHGVESVVVPERFPVGTADGLRERGLSVTAETEELLTSIRASKTPSEIEHTRVAQRANERAMAAAETVIEEATIDEDGRLRYNDGILTAERVQAAIEIALLEEGHALDETIVACGADAADPHNRGAGPLRANEPIVIDIFPRGKASGYHADMTRTFCKGTPSEELVAWYESTREALDSALDAIEPGVTGDAVHGAVCDVYEDAGHSTFRTDPETETGFIHSTGHGVGLAVHELPRLAPGGEELEAGQIVTVEPGLYDPTVGGVRIEDIVVVTDEGYENLTDYPISLVLD